MMVAAKVRRYLSGPDHLGAGREMPATSGNDLCSPPRRSWAVPNLGVSALVNLKAPWAAQAAQNDRAKLPLLACCLDSIRPVRVFPPPPPQRLGLHIRRQVP